MGAQEFWTLGIGKTAEEAFHSVVAQAKFDHGYAGYSGTIAEKGSFILLSNKVFEDAHAVETEAEHLMDKNDKRISDKWGPAGCLPVQLIEADRQYSQAKAFRKNNKIADDKVVSWLFFGLASS